MQIEIGSPLGPLTLTSIEGKLTQLQFAGQRASNPDIQNKDPATKDLLIIQQASLQLLEYFNGKRQEFSLPLSPQGTKFQKEAWNIIKKIPYGETRSYTWQSDAMKKLRAQRAVGVANSKNPLPIFIPCHRIIAKNGSLKSYVGGALVKKRLLFHEVFFNSGEKLGFPLE
ncbi:MAG: hypothetical protein CBC09_06570 [Cellvibrionales bacterium TMED49]|nr:cysteine methyltransferase [Porticoccaceae bacterium]OUU37693.1 MAG: hypothetical protein CBC09_06570 [Cellvibrionales bacterium TMED49]|tara:strand:+ start:747 stop:1256 length:510 start_codon:yes stop_codon:yes gene_type:complete